MILLVALSAVTLVILWMVADLIRTYNTARRGD